MLSYQVDGPVLQIKVKGSVTPRQYAEFLRKAFRDPRVPEAPALLSDATAAEPVGAQQVETMAYVTVALVGLCAPIHAIVADRPAIVGLAHEYAQHLSEFDVDCGVFPRVEEARSWVQSRLAEGKN